VQFDPLGIAQPNITVSSELAPGSIVVSNGTYMLSGADLTGAGALNVVRNGTFILDLSDNSTGPILIDNTSTLQVGNNDTLGVLGSGALTNNGGLLFNATGTEAYGYPVYGTGSITNLSLGQITLANNLNANYLVQAGAGSLLLQGSNNLTGGLVVSSGTVLADSANCLGLGPIIISGGTLEMEYPVDYPGSTMLLAGGLLNGGVASDNSYEGVVTMGVDSQISVDAGWQFILNNPAGLSGTTHNLTVNGVGYGGTLILAGANNTWNSVTCLFGTLQIGNGGATGSLGGGTITDGGTLAFDLS
jgi:autotransporter-associated beta strand protein